MNTENRWDAQSYENVSKVQQAWGMRLLRSRKWNGSEVVMDAGCGPGSLTRILADKVTSGKIFAVDSDQGMVSLAKRNLVDYDNVEVICADMSSVLLPPPLDVVFSNAAIHWVLDHRALFTHFRTLLAVGGELLLQYGGRGNLDAALGIADEVRSSEHFASIFASWKPPWRFSTPEETSDLLLKLGFRDIVSKLSSETPAFSTRQEFTEYLRTVILRPHLQMLEAGDKDRFVCDFLDIYAERYREFTLDYVRLTVTAKK